MKTDMRVTVTKRMLREGLLRCMESRPISKIKVNDLCRESGINRATFYNHYDAPVDIMHEMAMGYAKELESIYASNLRKIGSTDDKALAACLEYIFNRKAEIQVLFSANAERCMSDFSMEIISGILEKRAAVKGNKLSEDGDDMLCAITRSSAVYGLIQHCFTMNINRTPEELVVILKRTLRDYSLF